MTTNFLVGVMGNSEVDSNSILSQQFVFHKHVVTDHRFM